MQEYQHSFLKFAIDEGIISFGEFVLKSGRKSPYFFNSGLFNNGESLRILGEFYASAIVAAGISFDVLFGPAYKGIPLVASAAIALSGSHGRSVPYSFDRKEIKDHGEGGHIVGAPLHGRVLIVDDVISAGTSIRHSVELIRACGAAPAAVVIALDRQERGHDRLSAVQEVEQAFGIPVISIVNLDLLAKFLGDLPGYAAALHSINVYRKDYGAGP